MQFLSNWKHFSSFSVHIHALPFLSSCLKIWVFSEIPFIKFPKYFIMPKNLCNSCIFLGAFIFLIVSIFAFDMLKPSGLISCHKKLILFTANCTLFLLSLRLFSRALCKTFLSLSICSSSVAPVTKISSIYILTPSKSSKVCCMTFCQTSGLLHLP